MEWQRYDTECGAPLWLLPLPNVLNCSVGAEVCYGSRDGKKFSLPHALEHGCFLGGMRCLTTAEAMDAYVEDVGGVMDAETGQEGTFYYVKITSPEVSRSAQVFGEALLFPRFPAEETLREMKVVIREIRGERAIPERFLVREWMRSRFGNHPLANSPVGSEESVAEFNRADFVGAAATYYCPANITCFAVGGMDPQRILDDFNKHFPRVALGRKNEREEHAVPPANGDSFSLRRHAIDDAFILSGALIGGGADRDTMALRLFSTMLGGGASFPLYREVRGKHGQCYGVSAEVEVNTDVSIFYFMTATDPAEHAGTLDLIFQILEQNKSNEALLERAKKMMRGRLDLIDDTAHVLQHSVNAARIFGEPHTPKQTADMLDLMTIDDITRAVDRYLRRENFYTGVLMPSRSFAQFFLRGLSPLISRREKD